MSDFESGREDLMEDYKMVVRRRFERIYKLMECKSYMKNEDFPENKEIFVNGFNHIKTDKIDNYILIGCESDGIFENDKLFNFWSNKFIKKETEIGNFKLTGWSFMTLIKRNNFLKFRAYVCN